MPKTNISADLKALYRWKYAETKYIKAVKANHASCFEFFLDSASRHPDAICIWTRQRTYTWSQASMHVFNCGLYESNIHVFTGYPRAGTSNLTLLSVAQYASYFQNTLALDSSSLCAFYLNNSASFVFAWLGLWAIGTAPAMINVNLSDDALVHSLGISRAKLVLVDGDGEVRERIEAVKERIQGLGIQIVLLDDLQRQNIEGGEGIGLAKENLRRVVKATDPMALFYTSGTTGYPKAVPFLHSRLGMAVSVPTPSFNCRPGPRGDRWYICLPMYHGTGAITCMISLLQGVSVAIAPSFSVSTFWSDIRASESTFFSYVGELARYLVAAPPSPLDKMHHVRHMHGNGMRPDVWGRFRERFGVEEISEFFNSTEGILGMMNWNRGPWGEGAVGVHGGIQRWLLRNTYVPVEVDHETNDVGRDGKGFAKRRLYEDGGEILVRIPNEAIFPGYVGAEDATKKKFVRDVLTKGDLFYRSGDALKRDKEGRWWFMDRLGDTYRWKSENVSTAEVAEIIGRYPGVLEANVYGVLVPGHDGRAGCVALDVDQAKLKDIDWADLACYAKQHLPKYAIPVFIRIARADVGRSASHNQKQSKGPLREEGVDPALKGTKVANGDLDTIIWMPPKHDKYVDFGEEDWRSLVNGSVKL